MGSLRRIALALPLVLLIAGTARADRIIVRNGPPIKGKAMVDDLHPDRYLVFGERGKTPLVLMRDRVARIDPEPSILDEYVPRRKALASTGSGGAGARAEYDLGLWCEGHKLPDLASVHFEGSIKRDPSFGPGHKKLGHVEYGGKWLTASELKVAQGYILYKGRWITPEQKAEYDADNEAEAEQQSWMRRLAILRQAILAEESRGKDAEAQLLAIRDVAAVNPIVRTFGNDRESALRKLGARALAGIPGPEASSALVARLLSESDEDVRTATMAELAKSRETNVVPKLTQALQSQSLAVLNRAAWALGNLKAVRAVPKLVPVLVSSEIQMAWMPNPGSPGSGFMGMPPGTGLNINSSSSIGVLTGPVVGRGVVAFGATSVPSAAFGGGAGYGGGFNVNLGSPGGGGGGPTPQYVEVKHRNVEVLTALMKLTGQDFGYDIPSWRRWLTTGYKPDSGPSKSVPQP